METVKSRRKLRIVLFAVATTLCMDIYPAVAETLYKYRGDNSSPYPWAVLAITITNGAVSGQLRPLLGDDTPPVAVSGTNSTEGVLELTIGFPSGQKKYVFKKSINDNQIEWRTAEGEASFFRYFDTPLSEPALTLSQHECGAMYKTLEIKFSANATAEQLEAFLAQAPEVSSLPVVYTRWSDKNETFKQVSQSLGASLREGLKARAKPEPTSVNTPVGAETYIVQRLRRSGVIAMADLDSGGCGGADRSYFVVDRQFFFDSGSFSQPKFEQYIDERLKGVAQTDKQNLSWRYRLGQRKVTRVNVPPYPSSYRIKMYVASEITRQVSGWWDSFSASFEAGELIDTKQSEYAVIVTVERLKASKRSWGSKMPPDDNYFTQDLSEFDEAEVTAALSKYLSERDGGRCVFDTEGYEKEKHKAVC
jgi:hypothetical protein